MKSSASPKKKRNKDGSQRALSPSTERERLSAISKLNDLKNGLVFDSLQKIYVLKHFRYTLKDQETGKPYPKKLTDFELDIANQLVNFQNNFLSSFWEVGQIYDIKEIKRWKCKLTFASGKTIKAFIFKDKMNFVIAEESGSKFKMLVREKYHKMAFDWIDNKKVRCRKIIKVSLHYFHLF